MEGMWPVDRGNGKDLLRGDGGETVVMMYHMRERIYSQKINERGEKI